MEEGWGREWGKEHPGQQWGKSFLPVAKYSAFPPILSPCYSGRGTPTTSPRRPRESHLTGLLLHLCHSLQGSGPDPEVVPALHGPPGDEAALHLEHLPVYRVCWAARPGQGAMGCGMGPPPALLSRPRTARPRCLGGAADLDHSWVLFLSLKPRLLGFFCSSTISSATLWITSPPAVTTRVSMNCHMAGPPVSGSKTSGWGVGCTGRGNVNLVTAREWARRLTSKWFS